jgi:multidrug efflux pump subunit AcrA (membrane-fusion protein)
MFETETHVPAIPPQSAFSDLMLLAKLMADPGGLEKNLKELAAAVAKFEAAKSASDNAQAELLAKTAAQSAELARREQAAADREKEQDKREAKIDAKYAGFDAAKSDALADIDQKRRHLNTRMMAFAGLVRHPLQSEPTDEQIDRELFGARDAHYDDDSVGAVTEEMPRIGGGTLTRTTRNRPTTNSNL